jgi:hypothetical protein
MKTTFTLFAVVLAGAALAGCEKTEVNPPATVVQPTVEKPVAVPTPVPVPGPQGPAGEKGDKGEPGQPAPAQPAQPADNGSTH